MKIIIFGSTGMLGNYVKFYFQKHYDVITINRNELDAETVNIDDIMDVLSKYKSDEPTFVINCIGIIPQRNTSDNFRIFIKINTLFPHLLANCCEKLNFKMIHISTDCVYDGKCGNYSENDKHTETNLYGSSKSLGEPSNACVIRTSIIGEEIHNKKSLLEWVKSQNGKKINGYINHYWNGVTCLQLSKIIHHMIENNILWNGVRHIFSPKIINKYDLIKLIIEVYNLNVMVDKLNTEKIDKSLTSIFEKIIDIPDIKIQLQELAKFKLN